MSLQHVVPYWHKGTNIKVWTNEYKLGVSCFWSYFSLHSQPAVVLWLAVCPLFIILHYGFNSDRFTFGTTVQLFTYCRARLKLCVSLSVNQGNGSRFKPRTTVSDLSYLWMLEWLQSLRSFYVSPMCLCACVVFLSQQTKSGNLKNNSHRVAMCKMQVSLFLINISIKYRIHFFKGKDTGILVWQNNAGRILTDVIFFVVVYISLH